MPRIEQKAGKKAEEVEDPAIHDQNEPEIEVSGEKTEIDGLDELKRQLEEVKKGREEDRERRIAAERDANESRKAAYDARNEVSQSNETLIDSSIERVAQESAILKQQYAQAIAAGDHQRAADINERWIDRRNDLKVLQQGKEAMAEERSKPKAPPAQVHADPAEAFAAALQGPSRNWVLAHKEYANTPKKQASIIAAHNVAVGKDLEPDTPGYFAEVERVLGITPERGRNDVEEEDDGESPFSEAAAPVRRSAPVAAPVSRSGSVPGAPSQRSVRLSAREIEAAEASGITPEEYWKNKQAILKESTRH